jgi:hypothetical protein
MLSAADELKIFQNIIASSPMGLDDPQLIGKFAQAKANYHAFESVQSIQNMQNTPPVTPNNAAGGTISSPAGNTPQEPLGAQNALNTPNNANSNTEGQGAMTTP